MTDWVTPAWLGLSYTELDNAYRKYHNGAISHHHAAEEMTHTGILPAEAMALLRAPDKPSRNRGWR